MKAISMRKTNKSFILLILLAVYCQSYAQKSDSQWFEDARYGMFIHWGLYSAAEGIWHGERLRYLNDYAEWIQYRNRIAKEDYSTLAKRFDWDKIDPEKWVLQAKNAGMKYLIITAKHHDGVAIWDTKVSDYSLPKLSGSHRDVIREVADACRKYGIKFGFYYSHWIDWGHPYGWDHNQELKGPVSKEQYNQYWQEKVIPQLTELLTNYGKIDLIWFDMWIPWQQSIIQKEQLTQVAELIRKLQPECLINSRLGLPATSEYVDFQTLGDNVFGSNYIDHPWETPGTIAHSWGYRSGETEWKSISQIFDQLINNVRLNGDYTLNIGPRANGDIPFESQTRLNTIGEWLRDYGESVYGNTGLKFRSGQHDWGVVTYNKHNQNVYLHVFNWPLDDVLRVTGISGNPESVQLLRRGKEPLDLDFTKNGPLLHIQMKNGEEADPYDAIVRIKIKNLITDTVVVPESTFGGFSMKPSNAVNFRDLSIIPYDGKRPEFVKMNNQQLEWELYLPEKGAYHLDLSAHNPSPKNIPVVVSVDNRTLETEITPDGKVVLEPNQNDYTDEFTDRGIGDFEVAGPGKLKVMLRIKGGGEIWVNYLWIEKVGDND